MVIQPSREAYEALATEVKALKEENKRLRNEKKKTSRSTAEVELKDHKTINREKSRNSWADIYNENTMLRKHTMLLGQKVQIDDGLEWRVKWGQRGSGLSGLLALICWVAGQNIGTIVLGALVLIFFGVVYYKNFSFVIAKRLLREPNVVMILFLSVCNWSIDIGRPLNPKLDPILGLIYMTSVCAFVFLDAVKVKSRVFVMAVGIIFTLLNVNNIYHHIFGGSDLGIVLLDYSIQGNKYTIMKRSIKRSIYIQIMLFSIDGIYTLFEDRKQELLIFATGKIYRETGTASQEQEDEQYSKKIESEKRILV